MLASCIVIGPVCGFVTAGGRAGGVRTLLQPACVQCLRRSERFFFILYVISLPIRTSAVAVGKGGVHR